MVGVSVWIGMIMKSSGRVGAGVGAGAGAVAVVVAGLEASPGVAVPIRV